MPDDIDRLVTALANQNTLTQALASHETRITVVENTISPLRELPDRVAAIKENIGILMSQQTNLSKSVDRLIENMNTSRSDIDQARGAVNTGKNAIPWIIAFFSMLIAAGMLVLRVVKG